MAFGTEDAERAGPPPEADRSLAALFADLARQGRLLLRQELQLLQAELAESFGRVSKGAAALIAGLVLGFSGWLVLVAAAVLGLATQVPAWLAALLVGGAVVAIAAALLRFAVNRLRIASLVPERTLRSLREDGAWLKGRLR